MLEFLRERKEILKKKKNVEDIKDGVLNMITKNIDDSTALNNS